MTIGSAANASSAADMPTRSSTAAEKARAAVSAANILMVDLPSTSWLRWRSAPDGSSAEFDVSSALAPWIGPVDAATDDRSATSIHTNRSRKLIAALIAAMERTGLHEEPSFKD